MLARGTYLQPSQSDLNSGKASCAADELTPTPTSSCDVPGSVMYLYNDPTVPLYNFSNFNVRSYSDYVPTKSDPWQFISPPDISGNNLITNYLIIYTSIDKPYYTYTITIPVGICVFGTSQLPNRPANIKMQIRNASLKTYYNESLIETYSSPTFDTSMSIIFDVSNSVPGAFNANYFVGNMQFSGIKLYTSPTFVYSFSVATSIVKTVSNDVNYTDNSYFGTAGLKYGPIVNMTANTNSKNGPINLSYSSGIGNAGSFITGV
jgi:hypothetical protein